MARYARWRADVSTPASLDITTIASQLIGDDWRDNFGDKIQRIPATLGTFNGRWDVNNAARDTTVVVKCGRGHFVQINGAGWRDPQFPAQTIDTDLGDVGQPAGPFKEFLLCEAMLDTSLVAQPTFGSRWASTLWTGDSFQRTQSMAYSQTLLHEAMHAIRWPQGRADSNALTGSIGGRGNAPVDEVYGWSRIQALSGDQKARNADGYAILSTVLWMKDNTVSNDGTFGRRRRRKDWPLLDMPNDPHPPRVEPTPVSI
ncbi:hypothetical protein AMS68_004129 [Peltaster fructicola]|uniref:Uncharacterized protein n=1 Tax=Peltaster fructicola TaxID=286661 RepID=A0A6H0XV26_9PEZI|nr:hypothetical protein AMS68_004129 [Peltaster fructicola]